MATDLVANQGLGQPQQQPRTRDTWIFDASQRIPLQPNALAIEQAAAAELLQIHQTRTRNTAETLLEHKTIQTAIQSWREDLLIHQSQLRDILRKTLEGLIQRVPLFERARASYLHLKHHDLNRWETAITAIKILAPPLLLLYSMVYVKPLLHSLFSHAHTFTVTPFSQNPNTLQALCPSGFYPALKPTSLLTPTVLKPSLSDYTCRELKCGKGFVLKGVSCTSVNCSQETHIFDPEWGFCVARERTVPGLLWGTSSCAATLTWLSLFDLACWSSYLRLFIPWILKEIGVAANITMRIGVGCVATLLLLSSLRISVRAAVQYMYAYQSAKRLLKFLVAAREIALNRIEYRCFQVISPRLFEHLDTLQRMPPVNRAIMIAEMGFASVDTGASTDILRPLYVKCVQDVLSRVDERALLTLVEADLVESREFHTLVEWIENSSKEFRDEVGRVRAQHALQSFQEDIRSAVGTLTRAGKAIVSPFSTHQS